jgi:hypothetical protein
MPKKSENPQLDTPWGAVFAQLARTPFGSGVVIHQPRQRKSGARPQSTLGVASWRLRYGW